jgi:serine/threonine protein kinase
MSNRLQSQGLIKRLFHSARGIGEAYFPRFLRRRNSDQSAHDEVDQISKERTGTGGLLSAPLLSRTLMERIWRAASPTGKTPTRLAQRSHEAMQAALIEAPHGLGAATKSTMESKPGELPIKAPYWRQRYEVVRALGEGGMGRAVLARQLSDSALVCLKFLHGGRDLCSAEQECRALMRLRHPRIVSLLDFSLHDDPPWLAMEYASGPTLDQFIKEHGPLAPSAAIEVIKQVLECLEYSHLQGVIHRDLKPSNVIVSNDDRNFGVRILDFGIAIVDGFDAHGNITGQGVVAGTFSHMAPEQVRGQIVSEKCDLYALGLIAWQMLTGRDPYQDCSATSILLLKLNRASGFTLEGTSSIIPLLLQEWVERCTSPDPSQRPTAREAIAMLHD